MQTKWLTVAEAAEYLKMGRSTIYKLLKEGKLPAHKAGRAWRFDVKELDDWIKSGKLAIDSDEKDEH